MADKINMFKDLVQGQELYTVDMEHGAIIAYTIKSIENYMKKKELLLITFYDLAKINEVATDQIVDIAVAMGKELPTTQLIVKSVDVHVTVPPNPKLLFETKGKQGNVRFFCSDKNYLKSWLTQNNKKKF